jgi:hypothetical protein
MIVTYVMVAVCVIGVLGGVASVMSYDKRYGQGGSGIRVPRHTLRTVQRSRPSRQLKAVETALSTDPDEDQPACSPVRSHGRWSAR